MGGMIPPGCMVPDGCTRHNMRLYVWPDGSQTLTACTRPVFRDPGWESSSRSKAAPVLLSSADVAESAMVAAERDGRYLSDGETPPVDVENITRAVRRARAAVQRLARANSFAYFVTLTFDDAKVDRHDDRAVLAKLNNWLHNAAKRSGLAYVLVPERHKDGAIHLHGFINGALPVTDSGTVIPAGGGRPKRPKGARDRARLLDAGAHIVYNLNGWPFGFSTAIALYGNYRAAVGYVCKYIGKQLSPASGLPERIGGRWYYSGGPLIRPAPVLLDGDFSDVEAMDGYSFQVKATGDAFRVVEIPAGKEGEHDAEEETAPGSGI